MTGWEIAAALIGTLASAASVFALGYVVGAMRSPRLPTWRPLPARHVAPMWTVEWYEPASPAKGESKGEGR